MRGKHHFNVRKSTSGRVLRLESLEDRQMLSATPFDSAGVVGNTAALFSAAELDDQYDVVDVSDSGNTTGDLTFAPQVEGTKSLYNVSWDAIDGADSYIVQKQNDSGAWITYRKTSAADDPSAPTTDAQGLYAGKDATFRVYGVYTDANGRLKQVLGDDGAVVYRQGSFSPISISSTRLTYAPSEEATVVLNGSNSASADIRWYSVTDAGDVEITAAQNQLSYKPTVEESNYDLKAVATGTGASAGSTSEVVFHAAESQITATYDMTTHKAVLSWAPVEGATSYQVRIWRDSSNGYVDYANVSEPSATVNGLYAYNDEAHIYKFRIIARNNENQVGKYGEVVGYVAGSVAPISIFTAKAAYKAGQEINATVRTAGLVDSVEWFYTDSSEGTQAELADTTNDTPIELDSLTTSYRIPSNTATTKIKIVAKGAGLASGMTAVVVVDVAASQLDAGVLEPYVTLDRNDVTTWNMIEGAVTYNFLKGRVDENGDVVWARAAKIDVANGDVTSGNATVTDDGRIAYTINMFNAGQEGLFKVVAIDAAGRALEQQEFTASNFGLELDHDAYSLSGDVLTATTVPTTDVTYQWSSSSDQGATWTTLSGATSASYTVSASSAQQGLWYRLVATDAATGNESVVYARPDNVAEPYLIAVSGDSDGALNVDFTKVDGVDGYQVEYYLADAENPVWLNLPAVTFTDNGDGTITATRAGAASYVDRYDVRVRAVTSDGWSQWAEPMHAVEAPVLTVVSCDQANQTVTLAWDDQDFEFGYVLTAVVNGETTTINLDADTTGYVFTGIEDGATYSFTLTAQNPVSSETSDPVEFATVVVSVDSDLYEPGATLTATLSSDAAAAEYQWYGYNGRNWIALDGATSATLVPTVEYAQTYESLKVVATGTGVSTGSSSEATVALRPVESPQLVLTSNNTDNATLTLEWNEQPAAAGYRIYVTHNGYTSWFNVDPSTTSYTLESVGQNAYNFTIRATNAVSEAMSNQVDFAIVTGRIVDESGTASPEIVDTDTTLYLVLSAPEAEAICEWSLQNKLTGEWEVVSEGDSFTIPHSVDYTRVRAVVTGTTNETGPDLTFEAQIREYASTVVTRFDDVVDPLDHYTSLREAIEVYGYDGATITFDKSALGDQNLLLDAPLSIQSGTMTIDASALEVDGEPGITLDGQNVSNHLNIGGADVTIKSIAFVNGSTDTDNSAGSIYACYDTNLTIDGCVFENNASSGSAPGAVKIDGNRDLSDAVLTVTNTRFEGNRTTDRGGALYAGNCSSVLLRGCVIVDNETDSSGTVYLKTCSEAVIDSCLIANNKATLNSTVNDDGGSAVYADGVPMLYVYSSTITQNTNSIHPTLAYDRGAFNLYGGSLSIYNSIVVNNVDNSKVGRSDFRVQRGGRVYAYNVLYTSSQTVQLYYSENSFTLNASSPLFADPDAGDFSLADGSQAIDAGVAAYLQTSYDIEGRTRHESEGGLVDLGAYESQSSTAESSESLLDEVFADYFADEI